MNPIIQLQSFDSRLRDFIASCSGKTVFEPELESEFNSLALELFSLQWNHNPSYRTFCSRRIGRPHEIEWWFEIPAIPTTGFKELELSSLSPEERTTVFCSSGTTEQRRSRHFHNRNSLELYEHSLLPWFKRHLLPDFESSPGQGSHSSAFLMLTPAPRKAPHSSLVHMLEAVSRTFGAPDSLFAGCATEDGGWCLELETAVNFLEKAARHSLQLTILGPVFSHVQLLEDLQNRNMAFQLPCGSRVMETGGYKGRLRALAKSELHSLTTARLGIPRGHIVSEYGMSELSSQAYDGTIGRIPEQDGVFEFPPWARAQVVSPENGKEVQDGETGLVRVWDLANVYSVMALQTEDLAVRRGKGFELIGRAQKAEPRGCSLMALE